jgi:tRNA nucleotidyltransferase (CCA-adding enzyme)
MKLDSRQLAPELSALPSGVYLVGGAVRDFLLGRDPHDFDLATPAGMSSALAREFAKRVNGRLVELGRDRFTTFRVVTAGREFDFSDMQGSLEEDLGRRDCTLNALAVGLGDDNSLIDLFSGQDDLRRHRVRMIREQNFVDDPLRIVKLIRMAVQLDFTIEEETMQAMTRQARLLGNVAMERIDSELETILQSGRAGEGARLARSVSVDEFLFGRSIEESDVEILNRLESDSVPAWTLLTTGRAARELELFAREHKWPTDRLRDVAAVRKVTDALPRATRDDERVVILYDAGEINAQRAIALLAASGHDAASSAARALLASRGAGLFDVATLLSGEEIAKLADLTPGPEIGRIKRALLEAQLRGQVNNVDDAKAFVLRERG